jgi:hypothetical protein
MLDVKTLPPSPDVNALFWYSISTGLAIVLIWVLIRYLNKNDNILKGIQQTLQILVTNDAVKEERLNRIEEQFSDIEDKIFPLNRKRNGNN